MPHKINEGRPNFQDTPNELAYIDFKKWAYKNRKKIKVKLSDALGSRKEDGTGMYIALADIWRYDWANKFAKEWSYLHSTGLAKSKFGRALAVMMKSDNLVVKKSGNKLIDLGENKVNKNDIKYQLDIDYSGNTKPKVTKLTNKELQVFYGYKTDPKMY